MMRYPRTDDEIEEAILSGDAFELPAGMRVARLSQEREADPHQREVALMEAEGSDGEGDASDDHSLVPVVARHEPIETGHPSAPSNGAGAILPALASGVDHPPRRIPRPGDAVARSGLTDPIEIVERMARDILAARRLGDDRMPTFLLIDLGWSWSQVVRFGVDAGDLALTPTFVAHDVVDRMRAAEYAAEVAVTIALADPRTGDMTTMIDDLDHAGDAA